MLGGSSKLELVSWGGQLLPGLQRPGNLRSPAAKSKKGMDADERTAQAEATEARRAAMRNLLYRKDS